MKRRQVVVGVSDCSVSPSDGGSVRQSARDVGLPESFSSNAGGENRLLSELRQPGNTWTVQGKASSAFSVISGDFIIVAESSNISLSLCEETPLLVGRIFSLLRRPLQALQRLLCKPHQSPESPGER